jgi:hypothetical protein
LEEVVVIQLVSVGIVINEQVDITNQQKFSSHVWQVLNTKACW